MGGKSLAFFISFILLLSAYIPTFEICASLQLIAIVSNSADMPTARYLLEYVSKKGFSCFILRPDEYWKVGRLNPSLVIILGGPKAYGGIGEIVSGYLTEEEKRSLLIEGAMRVFYKDKVVILAGSTRIETQKAAEMYIDEVLATLWKGPKPKIIWVIIGYGGKTPIGTLPEKNEP